MSTTFFSGSPGSLCAELIAVLPVQHAAISTLGDPFDTETVCASDAVAAKLDELQLDLGEGPCWQARTSRHAVIVPDLRVFDTSGWPTLHAAIASFPIRAVYAFPLTVGALDIGAIDLYARKPDVMTAADVSRASELAEAAAMRVLEDALAQVDSPPEDGTSVSRRVVHQATGMVVAQLGTTARDALLIIRAHAFATDRSVHDVAADVVARTMTLGR